MRLYSLHAAADIMLLAEFNALLCDGSSCCMVTCMHAMKPGRPSFGIGLHSHQQSVQENLYPYLYICQ